jgi:aminopeptidase-like protein
MHHFRALFPICRSLTGDGCRKTLDYFESFNPCLKRIKFKTGKKLFDWEAPLEWNIRSARIKHISSGRIFADFEKCNLHVMGYSVPTSKVMDLTELKNHIYYKKEIPDAIPYKTSYYKKNWGFCMSYEEFKSMPEGEYQISIDSTLKPGEMDLSHAVLKGKKDKEIIFTSYICHPSMANNELSGPILVNYLIDYIQKAYKKTRYSYRFILQPETIGSIAYLSRYYRHLKKKMICGYNISCVGDNRAFSYVETPFKDTLADDAIKASLNDISNVKAYDFFDIGSDQKQYCSPLLRLPYCTFSRSRVEFYPEYHTSKDDLSVVSDDGINGSFEIIKTIIDAFELGIFPKLAVYCEPQLGKRGLYPSSTMKSFEGAIKARMSIISLCDGKTTIFQIANTLNYNLRGVVDECKLLSKNKIIKFAD